MKLLSFYKPQFSCKYVYTCSKGHICLATEFIGAIFFKSNKNDTFELYKKHFFLRLRTHAVFIGVCYVW
jgi:hypothetical protein